MLRLEHDYILVFPDTVRLVLWVVGMFSLTLFGYLFYWKRTH